jgi:D-ornithine 4,5-aminomutase subunit alpha
MSLVERPDDFETRRKRLGSLLDDELHARFWDLVEKIVSPLVEEARTHTTPSIERSVLLRMGFSSVEAKALVDRLNERGLLAHGAGRLILELALKKKIPLREAGEGLLKGRYWNEVAP